MADHPLRPATDRSLGRPLPHQQANRTQAPPKTILRSLALGPHAVLAVVSHGYPPFRDRFLRVPHPSATAREQAPEPCDLHVLSMPPAFALSQDQTLRFITAGSCNPATTNGPQTQASPQDMCLTHPGPCPQPAAKTLPARPHEPYLRTRRQHPCAKSARPGEKPQQPSRQSQAQAPAQAQHRRRPRIPSKPD